MSALFVPITEEKDFLHRLNAKSEEAFHELFRQFHSYLVIFAERRVDNPKVAEDIVQEVFIEIWQSQKQYYSLPGLKAYLYEAVSNRCINYWKHRSVENKYLSQASYDQRQNNFFTLQEEVYRELYIAISELPPRSREVILLYTEGKSNEEIARQLDLSIETIKSHKKTAIRFLKNRLGNLCLLTLIFKSRKVKFPLALSVPDSCL